MKITMNIPDQLLAAIDAEAAYCGNSRTGLMLSIAEAEVRLRRNQRARAAEMLQLEQELQRGFVDRDEIMREWQEMRVGRAVAKKLANERSRG